MPKSLSERLRKSYEYNPSSDMVTPQPGLPVFSTIVGKGLTTEFYDKISKLVHFPEDFPEGMLAQVTFEAGEHGVRSASAWESLEAGDANFRNKIGPAAVTAIAQITERSDIVREEFRLAGFILGAGAERFGKSNYGSAPAATIYIVEAEIPLDPEIGHTRRESMRLVTEVGGSDVMSEVRAAGLFLDFGGVTTKGLSMMQLWHDTSLAESLYNERLPRLIGEIFEGWDPPQLAVRQYAAQECVINDELLGTE